MSSSFREFSKKDFTGLETTENIKVGALQRIADSLERMEKPHLDLIRKVEYLDRRRKELRDEVESLKRRNRSLKGWVTRLKKKK